MDPVVRRGVLRYVVREYVGVVFVIALLGLVAGRWDWTEAWVLVAIYFTWVTVTIALLAPTCPELLAERSRRTHPNTKRWDKVVLALFGVETLARYVIASLDDRYGWTQGFPFALQLAGAVMSGLGFALVTWSMMANAWFSHVVRLQQDRGQRVATGGPYAWVRHPGYLGTCSFEIGTGMLLGSWPAVCVGIGGVVLLIVRTALEDRTLREELAGYEDYGRRVRWRLLPRVW